MENRKISKIIEEVNEVVSSMTPAKKYISGKKLNAKTQKALSDIEKNHNTSWAVEIFRRNQENLDLISLLYRGNKISYEKMFTEAYDYAKSLKSIGYTKGDTIPICVDNIPEFVYLMIGASFIGCNLVVVGDWFNKEYLKEILNETKSKYIFVSNKNYVQINEAINESNIEEIIMPTLNDSLPIEKNGVKYNPYQEIEAKFCHNFTNNISELKKQSQKRIFGIKEFANIGKDYTGEVIENVSIDAPFIQTYTSGTTDPGRPKGVIHSTRSYITLSRWKESDVSGLPSMRNMTVLGHIPTYTHMELSCAISDTLYEKCTLALEPYYDRDFFIYSLLINKPNFVPASTGFWTKLCDQLNHDEKFKNINMPFLMLPTVTGEECSPGEEYYYNATSKKHKFGTDKLPYPLSPVTFSIGGGTSESSGVFVTILKSLQEKKISNIVKKYGLGLTPHSFVDLEVLDKDGNYCPIGKPGLLVINGPCNMLGYTESKLNDSIYVKDSKGKTWLNQGAYSYKTDNQGRIKMKGRPNSFITLSDKTELPYYVIEDIIEKDIKNIMVAVLLKTNDDSYVCHIELQRQSKLSQEEVINNAMNRLANSVPSEVLKKLYLRIIPSFPVAPSGKRDTNPLLAEKVPEDSINCAEYLKTSRNVKKRVKQ